MFSASLAGEKIATSAGLSYVTKWIQFLEDCSKSNFIPIPNNDSLDVDGHLIALRIIIKSYNLIPIGTLPVPSALIDGGMVLPVPCSSTHQ